MQLSFLLSSSIQTHLRRVCPIFPLPWRWRYHPSSSLLLPYNIICWLLMRSFFILSTKVYITSWFKIYQDRGLLPAVSKLSGFTIGFSILSGFNLVAIALAPMYKWNNWYRRFVHWLFFNDRLTADLFG